MDKILVFAKHLGLPSHGWMRTSLTNLNPLISEVVSDLNSLEATQPLLDFPLIASWQVPPPLHRRVIGKITGTSDKFWQMEPLRLNQQILNQHPKSPLLIHYLDVAVELSSLLAKHQAPILVHCHGADFDWNLRDHNGKALRNGETYKEDCLRLADKVHLIANSSYSRSKLIAAGFPPTRVHINHFGIDVVDRTKRPDYTLTKFLFLGRLIPVKGPDLLISAFSNALERGLIGELTIAGDGPLMGTCKRLVKQYGIERNVKLLGAVTSDEGARLRANCDVFTAHNQTCPASGREETFGVSILEAMAAGLPVVTGRSGGIIDMITDKQNGFFFEPGDTKQHADLLLHLGRTPLERIRVGEAARATVAESFNVQSEREGIKGILKLANSSN